MITDQPRETGTGTGIGTGTALSVVDGQGLPGHDKPRGQADHRQRGFPPSSLVLPSILLEYDVSAYCKILLTSLTPCLNITATSPNTHVHRLPSMQMSAETRCLLTTAEICRLLHESSRPQDETR